MRLDLDVGHVVDEAEAGQHYGAGHHSQHHQEGHCIRVQERNIHRREKGPAQAQEGLQNANDSTPAPHSMPLLMPGHTHRCITEAVSLKLLDRSAQRTEDAAWTGDTKRGRWDHEAAVSMMRGDPSWGRIDLSVSKFLMEVTMLPVSNQVCALQAPKVMINRAQ